MKINLTKSDLAKVQKLLQIKENNINLSDYFLDYIYSYSTPLDTIPIQKSISSGKSEIEAYKNCLKEDLVLEELTNEEKEVVTNQCLNFIKVLNVQDYTQNPYYQLFHHLHVKKDEWELTYESYKPYELFIANDLSVDKKLYEERLNLAVFSQKFPFLAVLQNNIVWMSITPNEIETMKKGIEKAHGNVLTLGLGLGYFAYMCSIKKEVTSITIVEKDAKVVSLFKEYILPKFEYKEKIKIIQDDAFSVLNKKEIMDYITYCYSDIWHGPEDGIESYLKIKAIEKQYPIIEFSYWLESSLIAYFRRILLTLIEENLEGFTDSNYQKEENDYDKLINLTYHLIHEKHFSTYEEIYKFLSDESINQIITK